LLRFTTAARIGSCFPKLKRRRRSLKITLGDNPKTRAKGRHVLKFSSAVLLEVLVLEQKKHLAWDTKGWN
jgi:hypothetical protein